MLATLPTELLAYICFMFGMFNEGLVHSIRLRMVCRAFVNLSIQLPCSNNRWKINNLFYNLNTSRLTYISVFDLDEFKWVQVAERWKDIKLLKLFFGGTPKRYFNNYTGKYVWWNSTRGFFVQSFDFNKRTLQKYMPTKKAAPAPIQTYDCSLPQTDIPTSMTCMLRMTKSVITQHCNHRLTHLSIADCGLTSEGFQIVGSVLSLSSITRLNIGSYMDHDFSSIFANGYKLKHLNVSFCSALNRSDAIALIQMISKGSLTVLKMLHTQLTMPVPPEYVGFHVVDNLNEYFTTAVTLCQTLTMISLPYLDRNQIMRFVRRMELHQKLEEIFFVEQENPNDNSLCRFDCVHTNHVDAVKVWFPEWDEQYNTNWVNEKDLLLLFKTFYYIDKKKSAYERRNEKRNLPIDTERICKGCKTVWPQGSIKLQAFEGMQSLCHRSIRACNQHSHFSRVFG